jgi:hypothetical protein
MIVNGLAGGLDQENVTATDGLMQRNGSFAISEGLNSALAQGNTQFLTNCLGKFGVGVTTEYLNIFAVCNHLKNTSLYSFCIIMPIRHYERSYQHYTITYQKNATPNTHKY